VVVVGAGPAGALAALGLARQGVPVLLVERRRFPRWKVCGACLSGQALAALAEAGQGPLLDQLGARPLRSVQLGLQGARAELALPAGRVLSRLALDQGLVEAAVAAGATLVPEAMAQLGPADGGSRAVQLRRGRECTTVQAELVLVAAGLAHRCLPEGSAAGTRIQPGSRIGAGCLLAAPNHGPQDPAMAAYGDGRLHMAIGRHGYVGLVRLEDGALNVAAAFDGAALAAAGGPAAAAAQVLGEAGFDPLPALAPAAWQLTPALTRTSRPLAGDRYLLLGDAAGYVEPFTGEGMGWALMAALSSTPLALAALKDGWDGQRARDWGRSQAALMARRQRLCQALALVLRRPWSSRFVFDALRRWPALADPLLGALHRSALPGSALPGSSLQRPAPAPLSTPCP
jgi:menaquinone-9 beta-reductase